MILIRKRENDKQSMLRFELVDLKIFGVSPGPIRWVLAVIEIRTGLTFPKKACFNNYTLFLTKNKYRQCFPIKFRRQSRIQLTGRTFLWKKKFSC
jgi:hypothetical protein